MTRQAFSTAIKGLSSRNVAVATAYRDWAKRLPPGPVSRLASSMGEQRIELGKVLGEISQDRSLPEIEVEFEVDPASAAIVEVFGETHFKPEDLLKTMALAEESDHELLAVLAGAILPASSAAAERLASEAASARKRSIWAQDHLELLSMC